MTLHSQTIQRVAVPAAWMELAPSAARATAIDAMLRGRLTGSLRYLEEFARSELDLEPEGIEAVIARLDEGPVSPWVFALYSKLVAELAGEPGSDVAATWDDIRSAALLPAAEGIVPFDSRHREPWWTHLRRLFDSEKQKSFALDAPTDDAVATATGDAEAGLSLLRRADFALHEELTGLLRMMVFAVPAASAGYRHFNGASTFFFWGAALFDAGTRRSAVRMADLFLHESSHLLLFGLSAAEGLTRNHGEDRHPSPFRPDARPIDGIFHACFVATRVHLAMRRLTESGGLAQQEVEEARARRDFNGDAARQSLQTLKRSAELTATGEAVLARLDGYWADIEPE